MYMKITDEDQRQSTKVYTQPILLMLFSGVHKSYHFILFILRCLGIKHGDVMLRTHYFRRFYDLSLFIEQRFEFIYEIIFIGFS